MALASDSARVAVVKRRPATVPVACAHVGFFRKYFGMSYGLLLLNGGQQYLYPDYRTKRRRHQEEASKDFLFSPDDYEDPAGHLQHDC